MISATLFFFGITLIYTGFLASGRDLTTGLAVAFIGLVFVIKPALDALSYCRSHFGGGVRPRENKAPQKVKTRKVHLKIIKSEDDKPTIH
jgi:hypothetical protein